MNNEPVTDALARRFLLGDLEGEERQQIEALFLSDQETKNRILIAEEDLIEEYLEGSLTSSEREKFLKQYGQTPKQRRKIRIARSIKEYAAADAALPRRVPALSSWRTVLSALGPRNLKVFIPVAATLTIALVIAVFCLLELNDRAQKNRRLAIERQLAELNAPSSSAPNPAQVSALVLSPLLVRSAQPQSEVTPRAGLQVIELQLLWIQKEQYESYRAVVKRVGGTEEFAIVNLHSEKNNGGNMVRVRLPLQILSRGSYQVSLSGIAANGTPEPAEEYSFTVGG